MSPITHLLASWSAGDAGRLRNRDLALITVAGLAPDLDGFGLLADIYNQLTRHTTTYYYQLYHHEVLHGLFGAIVISLAVGLAATNRLRVLVLGFCVVHLHLLCDFVGSRGPDIQDIWPIPYLAPFSQSWTFQWSGQWRLDSWPNLAVTILLLAYVGFRFHEGQKSGLRGYF